MLQRVLKCQTGRKWLMACLLSGFMFSVSAYAADSRPSDDAASVILEKLQAARPDLAFGPVKPSPMPGLYQVQTTKGHLLYVSADGKHVIDGTIYGLTSDGIVDLQEVALRPVRQEKLGQTALEDMIVFPANGKRKAYVYVFTDVDCGYCRKLHQQVPAMNELGIEVRYLAFPRAGIGSASHQKIAQAWCSEDPQGTLTKLKNRESVDVAYCQNNPVAEQFRLGAALGVNGTPAIILADGTMIPGFMPADALAERLGL